MALPGPLRSVPPADARDFPSARFLPWQTLSGEILWRIILATFVLTAVFCVVVYFHLKRNLEQDTRQQLDSYSQTHFDTDQPLFLVAQARHRQVQQNIPALLRRSSDPAIEEEFKNRYTTYTDGTIRTRPAALHELQPSYAIIEAGAKMTPDLRRRTVALNQVLDQFSVAWQSRYYVSSSILTPEGISLIHAPSRTAQLQEPDNLIRRRLLSRVPTREQMEKQGDKSTWSDVYYDPVYKQWLTTITTPLSDGDRPIGVLQNEILLSDLIGRAGHNLAPDSYNFIVQRDGRILWHPKLVDKLTDQTRPIDLSNADGQDLSGCLPLLSSFSETPGVTESPDHKYYLGIAHFSGPDWFFLTVYPKSIIQMKTFRLARFLFFYTLLTVVTFLILTYFILQRKISRPLRELVTATDKVASGDFAVQLSQTKSHELGRLAHTFTKMTQQVAERETRLRAAEMRMRKLALVARCTDTLVLITDQEGRIEWVNDAFSTVLNYRLDELQGSLVSEALQGPEAEVLAMKKHLKQLDKEQPFKGEIALYTKLRETRWFYVEIQPLRADEAALTNCMMLFRDITARRLAQERQEKTERKIQETQKLESLGLLASGIAHDFNNLLTGVLGNTSLARLESPADSPIASYLEKIEKTSYRAAELCRQLLAYSGKGRFHIKRLDLSDVVKQTTDLLRLSVTKTAILKFNLHPGLPAISGDGTQLHQIIMNLVLNASDALLKRPAGEICLSTGVAHLTKKHLQENLLENDIMPGDYAYLEVSDNGTGMSAETKAKIFDPFFTTKFTGRGLGLAAVLGIIRAHKGTIKVTSELSKGTTFRIFLPVAAGPIEEVPPSLELRSDWRGEGTVLVVDDDEIVRITAARMLEGLGFRTILAMDGVEGVKAYRDHKSRIVMVIMDLTMPRMDGVEAVGEISAMMPGVKVLLMSGYNEQEVMARFKGKTVHGFLHKPFDIPSFREKIRLVIESPVPVVKSETRRVATLN